MVEWFQFLLLKNDPLRGKILEICEPESVEAVIFKKLITLSILIFIIFQMSDKLVVGHFFSNDSSINHNE